MAGFQGSDGADPLTRQRFTRLRLTRAALSRAALSRAALSRAALSRFALPPLAPAWRALAQPATAWRTLAPPAPAGPARPGLAGFTAAAARSPVRLWREHRLMTIAVALSLAPRILASLAFRPALFTPDSFGYLAEGVHLAAGTTRPSGYPILLHVLEPLHSLLAITTVQHLMGITIAVVVYGVLRRRGLPAWGATLAACPTLFDSRQIMLESAILPDTLYTLLLVVAVAVLLTRRGPTLARVVVAGLLLAWASVVRGNGAPEAVGVLITLVIWRAGWRKTLAAAAAFALPLLAYMGVFYSEYGSFALTNSDGLFVWSRTMSFANCAVIKPPADLRPLCPDAQPHHPAGPAPAWSVSTLLHARSPAAYLWAPGVWWRHDAHPGINATNNALATRFALDAIRAQPAAYLRTVASGVMLTFLNTDRSLAVRQLHFTPVPDVTHLRTAQKRHLREYAHTTSDTRAVQPYAYFLYLYQEPVYFTGLAFALVILAGLAGVIRRRRGRGGPGLLPWLVAAIGIVAPVALHEYHYRYAIPVVPLACLAAGLAFARQPARRSPAAEAAARAVTAQRGGITADEITRDQVTARAAGPAVAAASAATPYPPGGATAGGGTRAAPTAGVAAQGAATPEAGGPVPAPTPADHPTPAHAASAAGPGGPRSQPDHRG